MSSRPERSVEPGPTVVGEARALGSAKRPRGNLSGRIGLIAAAGLVLAGCNFFDKPPTADEVYKAVTGMKEQPFNIEGLACKTVGSGAYDCQFSASIVAGYVPGYVGDTRPDYKIVQINGRFSRAGDKWTATDLALLTTP